MKKNLSLILIIMLVVTFFTSCGGQENNLDEDKDTINALYSNLLDEESRKEVRGAMEKGGIPKDDIDSFFKDVDYFNTSIDKYGLVKDGFKATLNLEPKYDPYEMQDLWDTKNPEFMGYNCRITSFHIMRSLISIANPQSTESDYLIFDEQSINHEPAILFNEGELDNFRTLYFAVPTENTKDIATHVDKVAAHYKDKGIKFAEGDVSLISVYFHDEEGYLFVGHVGVLIKSDSDLIFIEKVAFQEPYQAIKFENRIQLNNYLMKKYDVSWGQETARPFIMENAHLMEGYDVNF